MSPERSAWRFAWLAAALLTSLLTVPAAATPRVLAFGDSLTDGRGDEQGLGGYPPRLQQHLRQNGHPEAVVTKSAMPGETTAQGLSRLGGAIPAEADIVVLMEGSNDLFHGISVETAARNMLAMTNTVNNRGAGPVLVTIPPFWFRASVNANNALTVQFVNRLREEAAMKGLDLVDVFDAYWTNPDRNFDLYNQNIHDPLGHPNAAGYDLIAGLIGDQLAGLDNAPPAVGLTSPANGAQNIAPDHGLNIKLFDFGTGVDGGQSSILIDGETVQTFRTPSGTRVELGHAPAAPWSGVVKVEVVTRDLAAPTNTAQRFAMQFAISGTNFFRGDIDSNGRVDGRDLALMAFSFGTSRGNTDFRASADLDNNGTVNGEDLAVLANNFGKESE